MCATLLSGFQKIIIQYLFDIQWRMSRSHWKHTHTFVNNNKIPVFVYHLQIPTFKANCLFRLTYRNPHTFYQRKIKLSYTFTIDIHALSVQNSFDFRATIPRKIFGEPLQQRIVCFDHIFFILSARLFVRYHLSYLYCHKVSKKIRHPFCPTSIVIHIFKLKVCLILFHCRCVQHLYLVRSQR